MVPVESIEPTTASFKEQVESKPSLLSKWIEFATNATLHGLRYVVQSSIPSHRRMAWALLLFAASGSDFGLAIALDVQTNESTFSSSSSGLAIIVHDQDTYVNYHSAFKVQPGAHASVAVKLTQYKRLPKPYRTNCSEVDSLAGIKSYTKDGCIYQCQSNHSMDKCGCREDYTLPGCIN
ncbi:FMRFamide-activated amiloride-sensitive sodium channel-like [Stylophora pistillata]|uniref:FMRFamide-activated amiloride-sensitive sodium channel-like n=1 Tax=Stylophora pistillata TaxID=50429 RepID=UPI000C04AE5B|nr:FMRFamide-activated amiloride-sensitive sodium channel-like [Stylophora pistillata]